MYNVLEVISKIIHRKKYAIKRKGIFCLITDGSTKFLIHKKLLKKLVETDSVHKILSIVTSNKELIIYDR